MRFCLILSLISLLLSCQRGDFWGQRGVVRAEIYDGAMIVTLPNRPPIQLGQAEGLNEILLIPKQQEQELYLPALFIPQGRPIPIQETKLAYLFVEKASSDDFRKICQLNVERASLVAFPEGEIPSLPNCRILGISGEHYLDLLIDPPPASKVIFFFSNNVFFSG